MLKQHLIGFAAAFAALASGQSLISVLENNGFSEYAALIRGDPSVEAASDLIVYAPTDAALVANNGTTSKKIRARFTNVNRSAPRPRQPPKRSPPAGNGTRLVRNRDELVPPGSAFVTLLDDPEFVNLGPGVNQSLVEKRAVSSELPVVFSGLGETIRVTGDDIPFDRGVIRPTNGLPTLPQTASKTLPFLGINTFFDALNQTGLLAELDTRRGPITILAPDDNAFKGKTYTRDQLAAIVRQHVLVDYFAYTPLLEDRQVYPTLGGGEVVVSVNDKGAASLGGARILAGDAILTNGAVHTIDKVRLLPFTCYPHDLPQRYLDSLRDEPDNKPCIMVLMGVS
ncbi:FAS1 domain-containing protein [Chaetomium tenue]|uniref:FAS1 domain-containing protein n=1 Tax=Chaetomium tenue TaxID=1854479 RepID=A0ACB7PLX7_9PEZI|nr:FAS1 domain-containing protein [Chaetomium globosum]